MEVNPAGNPFAVLTFISAPAVLTNASCVLLFGTGNRYGRAVDRVHQLSEIVRGKPDLDREELELRERQLEAGETRALLIVRALTCFYTAVAGFVASTLFSLIGALLSAAQIGLGKTLIFGGAFLAGIAGVAAMITGALMLARETRYSFRVLQAEQAFLKKHIHPDRLSSRSQ